MKRSLFLVAFVLAAPSLQAQATVADDGSLTLIRAGDRIGREDFSIRHVPTTAGAFETLTRGVVVAGTRRITVDLSTDSIGLPVRYQFKSTDDGRSGDIYRAEVVGHRYSARVVRTTGEAARELLLPPGTLIVEDGVLHPLQFVVARGAGSVPAVVPSRGVVVRLTVEEAGADRVSIALQSIAARRYLVREAGGTLLREVWVDAAGHLLKVSVPSQQLVAVRDDAPRSASR
jgi:hypothetical protein